MLNFLDFLGTVGGNILSLPGIVGLGLGMMTRNWNVAVVLGVGIGIVETLVFNAYHVSQTDPFELLIAMAVGALASLLGCAIRHKGATV